MVAGGEIVRILLVILGVALQATVAAAGEVMESSYELPDGARVLRHEVLVAAPPDAVWQAFSTSEGLQTFAAPLIRIDLRPGGVWEASYAPEGRFGDPDNIRNEVLSYIPGQMLSIRITNTPPRFPHPELAKQVFTVIEMLRINDPETTRVRISMLPYGQGEEWDRLYALFRSGNAIVLKRLEERFTSGPVKWPGRVSAPSSSPSPDRGDRGGASRPPGKDQ